MTDFGKRYDSKRAAGISQYRSDGSLTSRHTDVEAGAAEDFAAQYFGQKTNTEVYDNHGDGGNDFKLCNITVEVIHLGILKDGSPRMSGNLIVNPHEPWRHADIYLIVRGSSSTSFEIVGWLPHELLIKRSQRNFGYGNRFWCPVAELESVEILIDALKGQSGTTIDT